LADDLQNYTPREGHENSDYVWTPIGNYVESEGYAAVNVMLETQIGVGRYDWTNKSYTGTTKSDIRSDALGAGWILDSGFVRVSTAFDN